MNLGSCHTGGAKLPKGASPDCLTIALAGNANVGKSVIFNQLTGSSQIIGNWPGKTVESAQGMLRRNGTEAVVVDLPGIYSLTTFSQEEVVTREYIAQEKPDVIINVIGAPVLERNLFFTLQLMEMDVPLVVCLNQMDLAESKGITIDAGKLAKTLGVPVVATVAARRAGINDLVETALELAAKHRRDHDGRPRHVSQYGAAVEAKVSALTTRIESEHVETGYPARWTAVKLLEGDAALTEAVGVVAPAVVAAAGTAAREIEDVSGRPAFVTMTGERYALASEIARSVQSRRSVRRTLSERLERLTTHKVMGYVVAVAVVAGLLLWTFTIGNYLSNLLSAAFNLLQSVNPLVQGSLLSIVLNGIFGGLVAGVTLVIPYVVPFYLMLAILEDSGILTRVAFMLDSAMHQMGLHGKAIIPIILGYGCNVPAIYSTRIMGTRRERMLAALAITFSPCAARTIIIFGLVAAFVGIPWALALYAIDLLIMVALTRLAGKVTPGESTGLIMEMHSFKKPSLSVITRQTWARTKSLMLMVFPMYMLGTAAVQILYRLGVLQPVSGAFSFLTVGWLGLPAIAGVMLVFGAARKELILLMAVAIFGTNLAAVFTPLQLIVLALVGTIYPCFATVGALTKEFGWKSAWAIIGANLATAILIGGAAAKLGALW